MLPHRLLRLLLIILPASAASHAQEPQPQDAATLQVLIQEVRQLRIAIERSSSILPRIQMTLARYQSQQDRVERLERELRTLHAQVTNESSVKENMTAAITRVEDQLRQNQDAALKQQLEEALRQERRELENIAQREQQVRFQEAALASQLKTEQGRLAELSAQLDQLDRKLQDPN